MERLTYWCDDGSGKGEFRVNVGAWEVSGPHIDRLAAIEDILGDDYDMARLRELEDADRDGRCVVLPVPMHRTLLDTSDPIRPELLKNFRISATWDHCGIVFHSPWNIFLENIEKGHIRLLNEAAEVALRGEVDPNDI